METYSALRHIDNDLSSCFADAFTQMNNEPQIYGYMVLVMVSIAFFNFSGVSITKYMSATTRKVLDTLRTMVIWICQMLLHQVMMIMIILLIVPQID